MKQRVRMLGWGGPAHPYLGMVPHPSVFRGSPKIFVRGNIGWRERTEMAAERDRDGSIFVYRNRKFWSGSKTNILGANI